MSVCLDVDKLSLNARCITVDTCETSQRLHCHSVLRALQSNIYFKNCLCDQSDPDLQHCLHVHRRIFLHSCVRKSILSDFICTEWH